MCSDRHECFAVKTSASKERLMKILIKCSTLNVVSVTYRNPVADMCRAVSSF